MIKFYGDEVSYVVAAWSWGKDCANPEETAIGRALHWAYLFIDTQEQWDYLTTEHQDDIREIAWRHMDFISVPCKFCRAQAPLRAQLSYLPNRPGHEDAVLDFIDYHPGESWPEDLLVWKERGWSFTFFRDTLSDSRFDQDTFKVDPKVFELLGL